MCTAVNVTTFDPFTIQVCLSTDDVLPGCVTSSMEGRLRSVFMDSRAFGSANLDEFTFEGGSIQVQHPLCKLITSAQSMLDCQGQSMNGVAWTERTYFDTAFVVANNVSWAGTRRASLGCFYVKRFDGLAFTPPADGWSVGVTYSDTEVGRRAISATRMCLPPVAPLTAASASAAESLLSPGILGLSKSRVSAAAGGTDRACPATSMVIKKGRLKSSFAHGDPDKVYKLFQSVCLSVEVERVDHRKFQVCLSVITGGRAPCKGSLVNGTLAGIYFDSAAFGVGRASALTVENGTIRVASPICTSPNGRRKQGRVDQCGTFTGLHLGGKAKDLVLDVGLAVVQSNPLPSSSLRVTETSLGCFYVTGPPGFTARSMLDGWSMALRYNGEGKPKTAGIARKGTGVSKKSTYSIMVGKVCKLKEGKARE